MSDTWFDNLPTCERCGQKYGGSHYHCGQCDSTEVTSCYGHYSYGVFTCDMTPDELRAHFDAHRPKRSV